MILVYKDRDGKEKIVRLKTISHAKPITIGRGSEADIVVDDARCSRIHSAIRYWDDIFVIRDMKSRNGTFLNDDKIEVAKLNPGDVIRIGDTEFRVLAEESSRSDVTLSSE